jgi:hypothetical protein
LVVAHEGERGRKFVEAICDKFLENFGNSLKEGDDSKRGG